MARPVELRLWSGVMAALRRRLLPMLQFGYCLLYLRTGAAADHYVDLRPAIWQTLLPPTLVSIAKGAVFREIAAVSPSSLNQRRGDDSCTRLTFGRHGIRYKQCAGATGRIRAASTWRTSGALTRVPESQGDDRCARSPIESNTRRVYYHIILNADTNQWSLTLSVGRQRAFEPQVGVFPAQPWNS